MRKRLKAFCAFLVVAGEHSGPAAAIHEESRGLLEARRDEQGVRYAMAKLDRGSILAAKAGDPDAFAAQLHEMRVSAFKGVALPSSCVSPCY